MRCCMSAASPERRSCWRPRSPASARCCGICARSLPIRCSSATAHAMQPTAKALEIADQLAHAAWRRRQSARRGDRLRSRSIGPHVQPAVDRCRDDPLPAAADRPRRRHRAEGQHPGDAAGLTPVRTQAGSRRSRSGARRLSKGCASSAAPAIVLRRLCHRRPQGTSQDFERRGPAPAFSPSGISS